MEKLRKWQSWEYRMQFGISVFRYYRQYFPVPKYRMQYRYRSGLDWKPASASASAFGSRAIRDNAGFQTGFGFQAFKTCWLRPRLRLSYPRPFSAFRHFRQWKGVGTTPPGVSKVSVVEPSGKNQRIRARRVLGTGIAFFDHRSKFEAVLGVKAQIFAKSAFFNLALVY